MKRVIKFEADWCQPCKKLNPLWDKVKVEFADVKFESVDVDDDAEMASLFKIKSVPTLVFLNNDSEVDRIVGVPLIKALRTRISTL